MLQQIAAVVDPQGLSQPQSSRLAEAPAVSAFRHGTRRVLAAMIWLGLEPEVGSGRFPSQSLERLSMLELEDLDGSKDQNVEVWTGGCKRGNLTF